MSQKKAVLLLFLVLVLLVGIGILMVTKLRTKSLSISQSSNNLSASPSIGTKVIDPAWATYSNADLHFSFSYPQEFHMEKISKTKDHVVINMTDSTTQQFTVEVKKSFTYNEAETYLGKGIDMATRLPDGTNWYQFYLNDYNGTQDTVQLHVQTFQSNKLFGITSTSVPFTLLLDLMDSFYFDK
jgi:hypothetical protein